MGRCRLERDAVPESFELGDEAFGGAFLLLALGVGVNDWGVVQLAGLEHVVERDQDRVLDRADRGLVPGARFDPPVLAGEVPVLDPDRAHRRVMQRPVDLPSTTELELNVAPAGESEVWQALEDLSAGQKATAVLLLLLLESDAPLVIDQPEDDLDNRFITEGVVPKMRKEKRRRQFIFSTHNANIPVLGDAELIAGLQASGEGGQGQATIPPEHMGSIDLQPVRELVEELLGGGKAAVELRRLKYGF